MVFLEVIFKIIFNDEILCVIGTYSNFLTEV